MTMNLRPGEQEAIDKMKAAVSKVRENTWYMMRDIFRADERFLSDIGYAKLGKDGAIRDVFERGEKTIQKILADFLKKFPD